MSMTDNQKKCMDAMNDPEMLKFFEYAINNQEKMRELIGHNISVSKSGDGYFIRDKAQPEDELFLSVGECQYLRDLLVQIWPLQPGEYP